MILATILGMWKRAMTLATDGKPPNEDLDNMIREFDEKKYKRRWIISMAYRASLDLGKSVATRSRALGPL